MKIALRENLRRFTNRRILTNGNGIFLHKLFERHRVVERGIHGAFGGVESLAKAGAEHIGAAHNVHELLSIYDGHLVDDMLANELAGFRRRRHR